MELRTKLIFNLITLFILCESINASAYYTNPSKFVSEVSAIPPGHYTTQFLVCPLINKELEKELLCGMPEELSTSLSVIFTRSAEINGASLSVTCLGVLAINPNSYINTELIFNGKCFTSSEINPNFPAEIFWDHEIIHEENPRYFRTRIIKDQSTLFDMKLPAPSSSEYIYEYLDEIVGLAFIENFVDKFESDRVPFPFCQAYQKTAFLEYRNNYKHAFAYQLPNLDDVQISDQFGFELGIQSGLKKEDFKQDACVANILLGATGGSEGKEGMIPMLNREFYVDEKTGVISEESIAKNLPHPFTLLQNAKNHGKYEKFMNMKK